MIRLAARQFSWQLNRITGDMVLSKTHEEQMFNNVPLIIIFDNIPPKILILELV